MMTSVLPNLVVNSQSSSSSSSLPHPLPSPLPPSSSSSPISSYFHIVSYMVRGQIISHNAKQTKRAPLGPAGSTITARTMDFIVALFGGSAEYYKQASGTFLVGQWRRLHAPNAGSLGLIPGQETKAHIPQLHTAMKIKDPTCCNWESSTAK